MNLSQTKYGHLLIYICSLGAISCLVWQLINQQQNLILTITAQALIIISLVIHSLPCLARPNISNTEEQPTTEQRDFLSSNSLLNSLSDAVIVIDKNGAIKFINNEACNIIGFKASDAIGLSYSSIIKLYNHENNHLQWEQDPIYVSLQSVSNNKVDIVYLKSYTDKLKPISMQIAPIGDDSSDLLIAFKDISKEINKEREQLEFISTASHEMRTPIATINGYLGLALNPKIAVIDDKAREYILKAQNSVEHLGQLFKNLLNISKAEDQRMVITPRVINLISFIEQICEQFHPQLKTRHLNLVFKPRNARSAKTIQPEIMVHTDQDLLREVVSNLIENAIKYTKQGDITVDVTVKNHDFVVISVSDTGIGIPAEDIPHLFQKFYRVDNSQTREIGGTGLGLYLCRKIVESLHGRIWTESTLGKGSTFFIELTRIDQTQATRLLAHEQKQLAAQQAQRAQVINSQSLSPMSTYQPNPQTKSTGQNQSNYQQTN